MLAAAVITWSVVQAITLLAVAGPYRARRRRARASLPIISEAAFQSVIAHVSSNTSCETTRRTIRAVIEEHRLSLDAYSRLIANVNGHQCAYRCKCVKWTRKALGHLAKERVDVSISLAEEREADLLIEKTCSSEKDAP